MYNNSLSNTYTIYIVSFLIIKIYFAFALARAVEVPEELLELDELELERELEPELLELERLLDPEEPLPERELLDEELNIIR